MEIDTEINTNLLNHLYWEKALSQNQIAQRLNKSQPSIHLLMKKYNIKMRTRSEAEKGERNHFYGKRHSTETKKKISIKNSFTKKKPICFNQLQINILTGLLLGDGHIDSNNSCGRYTQGCKYLEFLEHIKLLLPLDWGPIWEDKKWDCYHLKSRFNPSLLDFRTGWYQKGKKMVPKNLEITPECLLYWFLSDGSIDFSNKKKFPNSKYCRIRLATDGFTTEENLFLIKKLKDLGIESSLCSNRISILGSSVQKFFNIIGKSPVDCYDYKWR